MQTNAQGTIETNDYPNGGEVAAPDVDSYPVALNPAETIEELIVTQNDSALDVEIHTNGGDVFYAFRGGAEGVRNRWKIDKVVVSDPETSGATFTAEWAGE